MDRQEKSENIAAAAAVMQQCVIIEVSVNSWRRCTTLISLINVEVGINVGSTFIREMRVCFVCLCPLFNS